jgi:hypothetical protein
LAFDLGPESAQGRAVGGVAGQHFISERQPLRRDHQRDDELRTIRPLVAAVAVTALRALWQIGCVDLEIGARQIVEQHVERNVEHVAPAFGQMREQRPFVSEQQVVTGVELVSVGQTQVAPQQVAHRTVEEPLAMQSPLAARRDQPIGRQHLQHVVPTRPLAARRQSLGPETIEPQLAPQRARQPAGAELARPAEPHLAETQPDDVVAGDFAAVFREQGQRSRLSAALVEHLDRPAPSFGLRGIDLAEVKHMPLHHAAVVETPILDDAPIEMRLPVLPALGLS